MIIIPQTKGGVGNEYTRAVARKMCVAAVARIYSPGCKFDNIVTLISKQGLGKSTFADKLGIDWYSDSFTNIQGKDAYDSIQGVWIMEMAEMSAMKKAEKEQTKHFISKKVDRYRVAYGRRVQSYPRQCICKTIPACSSDFVDLVHLRNNRVMLRIFRIKLNLFS